MAHVVKKLRPLAQGMQDEFCDKRAENSEEPDRGASFSKITSPVPGAIFVTPLPSGY